MKKIFLFAIVLSPLKAMAVNLSVGTGIIYSKINDPKLKYLNEYENIKDPINAIKQVNIGLTNNYKRFIYGVATNRLMNHSQTRGVIDSKNNYYSLESKINLDTASLGYILTKNIASFITIGNLQLKQDLTFNDITKSTKKSALLYGVGFSYKINHHSIGITFIAPSQAIKMEGGVALNYNYNFKIF